MDKQKLDEILKKHAEWLKTGNGSGANLSGANLS
jgi:hypothetical protein